MQESKQKVFHFLIPLKGALRYCPACLHLYSLLHNYVFRYLTFLLLNTTCPVLANRVDPDQFLKKSTHLDLHCLSLNM